MNATATKTAAKPAASTEPPKTADQLKQEQAVLIQSLADLKDVSKMEELMTSLKQVKVDIAEAEKDREVSLTEVSQSIVIHSIKLSELSEEARQMLGAVVAQAAAPAPAKKRGPATGTPKVQKAGEVLISIAPKGGRGRSATYNKGQAIPQYVPESFKAMSNATKGEFEAELAKHFTEAGKTYFGTDEGKAELQKWVDFVKTKNAMPKKK